VYKTRNITIAATPDAIADCSVLLPLFFCKKLKIQVVAPAVNIRLIKKALMVLIISEILAEGVGFEPTEALQPHRFSRAAH
jgi:hypothetical protein